MAECAPTLPVLGVDALFYPSGADSRMISFRASELPSHLDNLKPMPDERGRSGPSLSPGRPRAMRHRNRRPFNMLNPLLARRASSTVPSASSIRSAARFRPSAASMLERSRAARSR